MVRVVIMKRCQMYPNQLLCDLQNECFCGSKSIRCAKVIVCEVGLPGASCCTVYHVWPSPLGLLRCPQISSSVHQCPMATHSREGFSLLIKNTVSFVSSVHFSHELPPSLSRMSSCLSSAPASWAFLLQFQVKLTHTGLRSSLCIVLFFFFFFCDFLTQKLTETARQAALELHAGKSSIINKSFPVTLPLSEMDCSCGFLLLSLSGDAEQIRFYDLEVQVKGALWPLIVVLLNFCNAASDLAFSGINSQMHICRFVTTT